MSTLARSRGFRQAAVLLLAALALSPLRPVLACSVTMAGAHALPHESAEHAEHAVSGASGDRSPNAAEPFAPTPTDDWPCQDLAHCVAAVLPAAHEDVGQEEPSPSPRLGHAQQPLTSRTPGLEPPPPKH